MKNKKRSSKSYSDKPSFSTPYCADPAKWLRTLANLKCEDYPISGLPEYWTHLTPSQLKAAIADGVRRGLFKVESIQVIVTPKHQAWRQLAARTDAKQNRRFRALGGK